MPFDLDGMEIDPETEAYWSKEIDHVMEMNDYKFSVDKIKVIQQILNDANLWYDINTAIGAYCVEQHEQASHHRYH